MALEVEDHVSANSGTISFPSLSDRRSAREAYLGSTTFSTYRDVRPPVTKVSADGTLGWVIAEVEIEGVRRGPNGENPVGAIWAWIELYEQVAGEWKLVGNVSNRRPEP